MPRFVLETEKSLFEPIEVEIKGKVYVAKSISRDDWRKIAELDKEAEKGNLDAAYERLGLIIGKHKVIDTLTLAELGAITNFFVMSTFSPTKIEKNLPGPGEEKLQP